MKKIVVAKGAGRGSGMDWEFGVNRCRLLHLEWISNEVLPHDTGNYIQYPVVNGNGKESFFKRMYIHICMSMCVCVYIYLCIYN